MVFLRGDWDGLIIVIREDLPIMRRYYSLRHRSESFGFYTGEVIVRIFIHRKRLTLHKVERVPYCPIAIKDDHVGDAIVVPLEGIRPERSSLVCVERQGAQIRIVRAVDGKAFI